MGKESFQSNAISIGVIKGIIGAVPYLGTALNECLFDIPGRIQQKRVESFANLLGKQISKIEHEKINHDYLKSEEFFDLTRVIFESIVKTKTLEKQIALSKIYTDGILNSADLDNDTIGLFSLFIVELLPIQITLLLFVENNKTELFQIGSYPDFYDLFCQKSKMFTQDKYEFKYYCNDLENKGLISTGDGLDDYISTSSVIVFSDHNNCTLSILCSWFHYSCFWDSRIFFAHSLSYTVPSGIIAPVREETFFN